jgi:uncharacterized protein (DUF1778 family)
MENFMGKFAIKDARVEIKTTSEAKDLLTKAAVIDGLDLSSFMISSSMERARMILRDHTSIALSIEGQEKLANILQSEHKPSEAMKKLRSLPRLKVRE